MDTSKKICFGFLAPPVQKIYQVFLLIKSLRRLDDPYSENPFIMIIPDQWKKKYSVYIPQIEKLNVRILYLKIHDGLLNFPFGAKVMAAELAESHCEKEFQLIAWMDSPSPFVHDVKQIILEPQKFIGYRPVDKTIIASRFDGPIDEFWSMIYQKCHVGQAALYKMVSTVDQDPIRPYVNAGFLVLRPDLRLMRMWSENFSRIYYSAEAEQCYRKDYRYKIFIHQAVLAATIITIASQTMIKEFPSPVNYALHLHNDYPIDLKAKKLEDIIFLRYEDIFEKPGWEQFIPMSGENREFISSVLEEFALSIKSMGKSKNVFSLFGKNK